MAISQDWIGGNEREAGASLKCHASVYSTRQGGLQLNIFMNWSQLDRIRADMFTIVPESGSTPLQPGAHDREGETKENLRGMVATHLILPQEPVMMLVSSSRAHLVTAE
jgi:hypothetical protein